MAGLVQDLRYAIRGLLKKPGFTLIAVLTLALGIGANTALFSVVKTVLLDSLPYRQPDRLVAIARADPDTLHPINTSFGTAEDWKARAHSFDSIALYMGWGPTLTGNGAPQVLRGEQVTHNFFDTLGIKPALGRRFLPQEDLPKTWHVVLLSHAFWVQQFGADPKVLGKTIWLDETPFQIVGVLPESFQSLNFAFGGKPRDVWAPLGYDLKLPDACRGCQHVRSIARLKDGVTLGQAQAEMRSVEAQLDREFPNDYPPGSTAIVRPLRDAWLGKVQSALWLLLGATGIVLLIACANVANLLLTRAAARRREVAVRTALGASRLRIARQLITESVVLSLLGAICGVVFAMWGTSFLAQMAPADIPRLNYVHFEMAILLFAIAISIATGVLMGVTPALQATRVDQREELQQQGGRGTVGVAQDRVRSLLVISEVALAFVLTVASGLLVKSFISAMKVDPGFNPKNLFTVDFNFAGPRYEDEKNAVQPEREILKRVSALPGVEAAAIVSVLPDSVSFDRRNFHIQDRHIPETQTPSVDAYFVSPDYLRAMGTRLLRGRDFTAADAESPQPVALISETTAREIFAGEDALGRRIQMGGRHDERPWATVVGIVCDVRQYGLDAPATAQAYQLYTHKPFTYPTLVIRSSVSPQTLLRGVQETIWAVDKDIPIATPIMMSDIISRSLAQRRFTTSLLTAFGGLALLLATIGIYGVMAYTVAQRTSEFGIRVALGAQRRDIFGLVSREGMRCAAIGLFAGFVASLAITRLLASQLFGVSAVDPLTFASVFVSLGGTALLACYIPARRATRVDPLVALRYE